MVRALPCFSRGNLSATIEINDFLESVTSLRTKNPLFYCLRLKGNADKIRYKPPFRKGFHSIILFINIESYQLFFAGKEVKRYNSFLVLQSPGLLMSYRYKIGANTRGYLIFFKPEFLSFFKPDFGKEFSFFNMLESNFLEINSAKSLELEPYFEDVFTAHEKNGNLLENIAPLKLLVLLYIIKQHAQIVAEANEEKVAQGKGAEVLFQKFLQLVSQFYLEKRTVKEYAQLLSVSPNYLSLQIKKLSNKSAFSFINDRMISEAKSFILHTDNNINETAQQLNFSDTSNFVKFFKTQTGQTPVEYRKHSSKEIIHHDN